MVERRVWGETAGLDISEDGVNQSPHYVAQAIKISKDHKVYSSGSPGFVNICRRGGSALRTPDAAVDDDMVSTADHGSHLTYLSHLHFSLSCFGGRLY